MNKGGLALIVTSQQLREDVHMTAPLLAGAALGLSVAAPFGPVSLICVQQSLNRGYRHGVVAGLGASTAHGVFATAAIAGAGMVSAILTPWAGALHLVSALVLIGLGIRTMLRARSAAVRSRIVNLRAAYASSLILSLSNPMTVIPYLALATVGAGGSASLSLWSIPGVMLSAATWYACISFAASAQRLGMPAGISRLLNLVAGGSLIGFGAVIGRDLFWLLAVASL